MSPSDATGHVPSDSSLVDTVLTSALAIADPNTEPDHRASLLKMLERIKADRDRSRQTTVNRALVAQRAAERRSRATEERAQ